MNQIKNEETKHTFTKRGKKETGITIVTLVITIIVLLILSGITITALSGDNGILKRAAEAKQETEKNQVIEMVQLEVLGTYAEADGEFDSEKFKENVKDHLKNYNPVISEDEKTITVEVKKYEVVVDKETGEVVKKGEVKGVTPIFETKLYNEDGTELKGEGKGTVIVGVKLTNKEKLDKYSIEIKNSKGEKIEADTTTIGEGEVSFTIEENGKYTIIVKGTKDGTERTNQRTIEIDVGEKIITNIEIRPNGGAKYIVPTEGKAKIKVGIEEKAGENKYKYSYGWSTDETEKPTTWTETASKAEIEKTDCEEGRYYLWIKVVSEKGNEKYIESNKFEVISNRKITIEANTKEITNKDVKLKINYDELLTENRNIEVTGKRGTDYEINGENEVIIKTNNQTVTVSATDIAGNKITEKTIISNIDKAQPVVTFGTNGNTSYKKSQSTTVTVKSIGVSTIVANSLKYQWTQSTTAPAENTFSTTFTSGETITKTDGTGNNWYLWIIAKNTAGTTIITKSNAFYLDNTAPNTTEPAATGTTNTVIVTFAQTDAHSGIDESTRQYSIKKTSDSSWGTWVTDNNVTHTFTNLTLNTEYQVRTQVKDIAGNGYTVSGTKAITTVNITKPTITLSTTAPTNQNITATITYPNITGLTKQYSYDNKTWTTYTAPLTIDTNKTIYARSIDSTNQGSDSTRVASLTVTNIDKTQPTVTFGTNGSTSYKKSQSTTVTVTNAGTSTVNASSLKYQWTQSTTAPAESSFTATFTSGGTITKSDGTGNNWYLWILAKNTAGNATIVKSNVFYLDNTAPNTTVPTATSTTNSIVVTSAQTDANSGINASTRQYSIKKTSDSSWGSWVTDSSNTHTFTNLTLNTEYQVRTQVKDALGNGYAISAIKTITTVNITKPTITLSTTSPTNKSITATITYPNITGITKQYSYDNKTWTKYTTALTIDTNKTIYARSIDSTNQGSDSTRVASLSVTNIDKTPPTVTHTIKNKKAKSVDIVITATDDSGIKSIANVTTTGITKTDTNTYTVTKNQDYEFKVTDNAGNVTNYTVTVTGITKITLDAETIAKNPEAYYGKKVNNYTAGGKTYRIFYVDTEGKFGDKNTVYLKADWTDNNTSLTTYTPSGTDLEIYKKLNPSWAAQRGSSTSNWYNSEKAAAWLCSPSQWTNYLDSTKANYAVGSPPVEMYVASYNQVSHTIGNYTLGATYRATDAPGYIYTLNGKQSTISGDDYYTGLNSLDYIGYNSMYCGLNGTKGNYHWELASPSAEGSNEICYVDGYNIFLNHHTYNINCGVCPLVSLKSDFEIEITAPTDAETIAENPGAYYGQKVTNYTAGGKTYRIFYVDTEGKFGDKNTIYLKADWTANDTTLSNYTDYTPSGTDLETYKKLNPSWAAKRGSNTSSWNKNEHAAAWLCSPSKWTTYLDTTKANYAIGAPTAEMYVASYNQVSHTTGNYKLGATYRATSYPGYIYTVNGTQQNSGGYTNDNTLDYTGYNSMYCGRNGSKGDYWWWLASPSANNSDYVCSVRGNYACLSNGNYRNADGVCPLVALKPGVGVELENEIEIADAETIAENPQNYYGKKISNYTAGGQTYRIFYVDKQNDFGDGANTVYLKADYNDNLQESLSANISSLTANDLAVYKRMNKSWATERGNSQSSWNRNEQAAAWLCSPSQWTTYVDSSKANYAIGGPSVEMYVASYNQVSHTIGNYKLGVTYRETSYPGYICTVNGTQQNSGYYTDQYILDYIGYNSMYCGKNGSTGRYYWWLASPSAFNFDYVYLVYGNRAYFGGNDFGATAGVCPLVSLKSGIKLIITSE